MKNFLEKRESWIKILGISLIGGGYGLLFIYGYSINTYLRIGICILLLACTLFLLKYGFLGEWQRRGGDESGLDNIYDSIIKDKKKTSDYEDDYLDDGNTYDNNKNLLESHKKSKYYLMEVILAIIVSMITFILLFAGILDIEIVISLFTFLLLLIYIFRSKRQGELVLRIGIEVVIFTLIILGIIWAVLKFGYNIDIFM